MSLSVTPERAVPFRQTEDEKGLTTTLLLSNSSDRRVMYKIRINVLKVYSVKPAISIIRPGERLRVEVQMSAEGKKGLREKDKLLIQYRFLPDEHSVHDRPLAEEWRVLGEDGEKPEERVLRVHVVHTDEEYDAHYAAAEPLPAGEEELPAPPLQLAPADTSSPFAVPPGAALLACVFSFLLGSFFFFESNR
ncbi:MAG: uncharacterized protein A8A55_0049 [Amphiamblys sp. WSBS2006]|nr:MAG: uncharacterized protein A8A55_0049 [Amphiamblys sp. WSBS2006]